MSYTHPIPRHAATIALLLALALVLLPSRSFAASAQLAADGKAALPIVLVDPAGDLGEAFLIGPSVQDLAATLGTISGAEFEQRSIAEVTADSPPAIYVGLTRDLQALGVPDALGLDACLIRTTANGSLILTGDDPRSISHAIYRLLHHLGCRWFYPGEEWAVLPEQANLRVELDLVEQPDFPIQRRIWVGHGLRGAPRPAFDDWQRRNMVAQPFDVATSHSWFGLDAEKDFATNPQWFAEVNGERRASKPSYAHPDVIAQGIRHALNHFEKNPDSKMLSLSPPDGLNYDTSDLAKKQANVTELFEAHGTHFGHQPDGTLVSLTSENVFHFVNAVAKAVAEKYPGKMVGILAYSAYAHPPSFDIEPNVYVELTRGYRRTPLTSVEQIIAFSTKAKNLGIYEYYDVEQWSWERPGHARAADLNYLQGSYRFYQRYNMRALSGEMSSNFGPYGVGYYVISQLLWDAAQDVRQLETDFYKQAFGPAAEPMQRIYRRWESRQGLDEMALAATYRDLAQATQLTEDEPAYRTRVNRIKLYAHFLKIYLQPKEAGTEADDVQAWNIRFGEEATKQRVDALGRWVGALTKEHMVHGQGFNRYFVRRGKVLGLDTKAWDATEPPSEAELDAIFAQDLADLAHVEVKPVPAGVFSQKLVPVTTLAEGNAGAIAGLDQPVGWASEIRKATVILKLDAKEKATLTFDQPGGQYTLAYLATEDFESGMDGQFATPVSTNDITDATLTIEADAAGYYFVRLTDIPASLTAISHPHAMPQDDLQLKNGRFFFHVPNATAHFLLHANAYIAPTIKLHDPQGNVVVEQDGLPLNKADAAAIQRQWLIDVPQQSRSSLWSVEAPGDMNRTNSPGLTGLPKYFAIKADQLLVPADAR